MKIEYSVKLETNISYIKNLNMIISDLNKALKETVLLWSKTECFLKSLNMHFSYNLKSYEKIKLSLSAEIKIKHFDDFMRLYDDDFKIALLIFQSEIDECLSNYCLINEHSKKCCLSSSIKVLGLKLEEI